MHQSTEIMKSWRSVCMIPIAHYLLQEKLDRLEAIGKRRTRIFNELSREEIQAYWVQYDQWEKANLNPKQQEWMQEIRLYLNSLQSLIN